MNKGLHRYGHQRCVVGGAGMRRGLFARGFTGKFEFTVQLTIFGASTTKIA
jgi:hypothetical protein